MCQASDDLPDAGPRLTANPSSPGDILSNVELVERLIKWAEAQSMAALPGEAVPGTTEGERSALAAIGGVAAALACLPASEWPLAMREWMAQAPLPPDDLVRSLQSELEGGRDVLAMLYEGVVAGRNRRRLGTFFTPPAVVEFMLDLAEEVLPAPAAVIDPGAGVGAFSLAAKRRWPDAEVTAVDLNLVTLGLLAARPAAQLRVVLDNYLEWAVRGNLPAAPRLWIGNPPYTRHQELSAEVKKVAQTSASKLVKSGLAGLSAYFLAATVRAMSPGDALCFLLPGSWIDTRYGRPMREMLRAQEQRLVRFEGFSSADEVFPGTRVTAMVVLIGPERSGEAQPWTTSNIRMEATGIGRTRPVSRDRSAAGVGALGGWLWPRSHPAASDTVELGTVARVRRGVATGANEWFLLTQSQRDKLPSGLTVRAVRRLRGVVADHFDLGSHGALAQAGERCWLLRVENEAERQSDTAVSTWLAAAEKAGVSERYLASHREPWYRLEPVDPPSLMLSPMGKQRMRVVINEAGAVPSNALYGLYFEDPGVAHAVGHWLAGEVGQVALFEHARAYGAGLFKLEPKDVARIGIPRELLAGLPAHPEPHLRIVSLLESDAHVPPAATESSALSRQAGGG
jgi:adenine-specific DNA-methyltransferase